MSREMCLVNANEGPCSRYHTYNRRLVHVRWRLLSGLVKKLVVSLNKVGSYRATLGVVPDPILTAMETEQCAEAVSRK